MANLASVLRIETPPFGKRAHVVLVVGALGLLAFALTPDGVAADALFVGVSAFATGACLLAIRTRRLETKGAWQAVAAALVAMTLGNVLTTGAGVPALAGLHPIANVFFLGAYPPLFVAAYRFAHGTQRSDRTVFVDTAIVGLAAIPFVWEMLIEPAVPAVVTGLEPVMALAIPVVDVALLSLAAPLLLFRSARSASATLFVAALAAMAVGDTLFAIGALGGESTAAVAPNLSWLWSYLFFAAAAWVPSAGRLGATRGPRPGMGDSLRLLVLSAGLLASPLVMLRESGRDQDLELEAFAVIALVIASLVVLRLQRTLHQLAAVDLRFRRFMNHGGFLAVIKDGRGAYVYMNEGSERLRRNDERDWYGRTDAELYPPAVAALRADLDAEVRRTGETISETVEAEGRTWHTERFAIPGGASEVGILGIDITRLRTAEREIRLQARLLESVRDAVVVVDTQGRFTYWNKGAEEIFGVGAAEMLGQDLMANIAPTEKTHVERLWQAVSRGEPDLGEWQTTLVDGRTIWLNARMSPISAEDGSPAGFLAILKDVTARKESELELRQLGLAIDRTNDAVIVTDGDDRVSYVNPAFERMTGFSAADVIGERPCDHPAGRSFARALEQARRGAAGWRGDLVDRRRDGTDLIAQTSISPISGDGSAAAGFVTIKRDVTHERAAERAADRRTRERALIAETLGSIRAGETAEDTAEAVCRQVTKLPELSVGSIITFGFDGRASVIAQADRYGRGKPGLELSPERSEYLRVRADAGPWVERWAADETHPYNAFFADLGIMANAYAPLLVADRPFGLLVGGSDQIDAVESLAERLPALIEFAAITTTLLAGPVRDRVAVAQRRDVLRRVIAEEQFDVHFQPIVELVTGATLGYEALSRFADGVAPDVRFQEAIDVGLGLELEVACLKAAMRDAEHLPRQAWLNVNVSPEIVLGGLVEPLLPDGTRDIVLEITEHQAITDYARFRQAVEPMRDRVRIAIDDAGAGFASLRHIVELDPTLVKLDRSLVAGIADDNARQAVVAGMVKFARSAGLSLIAEGVETEAELALLRKLGVPLGQGYLLGGPAPVAQVAAAETFASTR